MKLNTKRLQEEIFRCNITQRTLAEKIGVTEVSVSRYVHGERMPKGNILVEMARVLGTTPSYLTGIGDIESPEISYAETWVRIRMFGKQWSKEDKQQLIIDLLKMI